MKHLRAVFIHPEQTIQEAIDCLNQNERGAVVVVDRHHHLLDVVADGDIRRCMLQNIRLQTPIGSLQKRRRGTAYRGSRAPW